MQSSDARPAFGVQNKSIFNNIIRYMVAHMWHAQCVSASVSVSVGVCVCVFLFTHMHMSVCVCVQVSYLAHTSLSLLEDTVSRLSLPSLSHTHRHT